MASVVPFPRTMASIARDLIVLRHEHDALDRAAQGRDLTDAEDRRWAYLDQRMFALRDEGRDLLLAATGLTWDAVEAVVS